MLSESDRTGEDVGLGDCASARPGSRSNASRAVMKMIRLYFIAVSLNRFRYVFYCWGEGDGTPPPCMASKIESLTMFRLLHASSVAFTRFAMRTRSSIVKL